MGDKLPRIRSYGGCLTCKARKVKCDELKPFCKACQQLGLYCAGYSSGLTWISYKPGVADGEASHPTSTHTLESSSRRVLYTEKQRNAMSLELRQSMLGTSLKAILDELSSNEVDEHFSAAFKGPFGAFHVKPSNVDDNMHIIADQFADEEWDVSNFQNSDTGSLTPSDIFLDSILSEVNSSMVTFSDQPIPLSVANNIATQLSLECRALLKGPSSSRNLLTRSLSTQSGNFPLARAKDLGDLDPSNVNFLLESYNSGMTRLLPMSYNRKPPWQILHLPSTRITVGEILLRGESSHAKTSLFFSILAISAFNCDKIDANQSTRSGFWWNLGQSYKLRAKSRLQQCLKSEVAGPGKAKYKDILMALLTIVTSCVASGSLEEARYYILDAERFIALRGLGKAQKSRKVMLLHNIFLYQRVIEESTFLYPQSNLCADQNTTDFASSTTRFPSLSTYSHLNRGGIGTMPAKDFELLLLSESGSNGTPTVHDIYGIPETLLELMSRTTHLAHEMSFTQPPLGDANFTANLAAYSKKLENRICNWKCPEYMDYDNTACLPSSAASESNQFIMHHLVLALHSSLIIFFYRRVRDVSPVILQVYVEKTLEHLINCAEKETEDDRTVAMVWPGFIAACEALSDDLQMRMLDWLRKSAQRSRMRSFDVAADIATEVWRARRETDDVGITWVDILRKKNMQVILT